MSSCCGGKNADNKTQQTSTCCGDKKSTDVASAAESDADTLKSVKEYYGDILQSSSDLKTSACTAASRPHPVHLKAIKALPTEVNDRFYGCGDPVPFGLQGDVTVLDLGCGVGRDCFLAAALAGEKCKVIGLDMTPKQLEVAERNVAPLCETFSLKPENFRFTSGYIEDLQGAGIESDSVDVVCIECVWLFVCICVLFPLFFFLFSF
jgi:arsenite methyltransferase